MKKLVLIIMCAIMLTGCSNNCECNKISNGDYKVKNNVDMSIKISGTYERVITFDDIKDLIEKEKSVDIVNPLYTTNKSYVGANIIKVFEAMGIDKFEAAYIKSSDTNQRFTYDNLLKDSYIVLFEDGIELEKPKFIKLTVSDVYSVSNLEEIVLGSDLEI